MKPNETKILYGKNWFQISDTIVKNILESSEKKEKEKRKSKMKMKRIR